MIYIFFLFNVANDPYRYYLVRMHILINMISTYLATINCENVVISIRKLDLSVGSHPNAYGQKSEIWLQSSEFSLLWNKLEIAV